MKFAKSKGTPLTADGRRWIEVKPPRPQPPARCRTPVLSDEAVGSPPLRIDLISRTSLPFLFNYVCPVFTYISQMDNRRSEQDRTWIFEAIPAVDRVYFDINFKG